MKLLIAYDGSANADRAVTDLRRAGMPNVGEARVLTMADAILPPPFVGRVADGETLTALSGAPARAVAAVQTALDIARVGAKRTRAILPGWTVTAIAQADSPAWGIIKESDGWQPDLVLVGSQGLSAVGRFVIGSVSHKVLTEGRCNVRIARGRRTSTRDSPRFIVGVDGSHGALEALSTTAARQWPPRSEALLLCAFEARMSLGPLPTAFLGDAFGRIDRSDRHAWMQATLEQAATLLRASNADISVSTLLREGDPKRVLVEHAREWRADSIFVGARGLATESMLLGSVASAVAMRAHCSVEVVHRSASNR